MTMGLSDIFSIVATAFLSVGGAGALIVALWKFFGERVAERWLEGVKRELHATELAHVQHQLDRLGQSHQAQLDRRGHGEPVAGSSRRNSAPFAKSGTSWQGRGRPPLRSSEGPPGRQPRMAASALC